MTDRMWDGVWGKRKNETWRGNRSRGCPLDSSSWRARQLVAGSYSDGRGLLLKVDGGSARWMLRIMTDGSLRKWLDAWVEHAKIEPGTPLFRGVDRWQRISPTRVKPPAICAMLRRRMKQLLLAQGMKSGEAHLEAQRWSGHPMRAGLGDR